MTVEHLVVVGASLAGLRAVEAARTSGWHGDITLVGAEPHLPYDRPPLSKAFLAADKPASFAPFRTDTELASDLGVRLRLGQPATGLDTQQRRVLLGADSVTYDALVIATGARPRPLAGCEGISGVHPLRSFDDALAVRSALDAGARTVVIGAGFIGSEIASAARKRGLPVTIVEQLPVPLTRSLGPEPGDVCADLHRAAGTGLRLGVGVAALESRNGRVTGVALDNGEVLPADLVVVGIGVIPSTEWLAGSGVALHDGDGGVVCDAAMATSVPGVWAAGDLAHVPLGLFDGDLMRLEHWTNAAEQGALAARNALSSGVPEQLDTVPYFWSDWYDHRLQFVGTPRADEVRIVGPRGSGMIALYRRDDRVVGTFTIDRPRDIMKFRRRIVDRCAWDEAVAAAEDRVGSLAA